ncbi:hypothetical protein FCL47_16020 [Desulfopila sp. IMCC35006]|uniref:hypothetical protein n=1 Tax=Desulfopila sp. IMCC35006 TaxID=2569542 RepID=UPI0010AC65D9|nr:hypothetical protein [Desulfopila sp. IMCC35006]TKB25149.1 hypothetical protein FCL47_16020 [Desulfopila sp. IMCC35006]
MILTAHQNCIAHAFHRAFDARVVRNEGKSAEHMEITRRFSEGYHRIEQRTYGKYLGEDEAATLANLQAEVEALKEREKAVQALWKSLAAGVQSAFKELKRDLATLNSNIDKMNLGFVAVLASPETMEAADI